MWLNAQKRRRSCAALTHRVHLSEHRPLAEEERLPGVHQDQVKVGLPGPVGGAGLGAGRKNTLRSLT